MRGRQVAVLALWLACVLGGASWPDGLGAQPRRESSATKTDGGSASTATRKATILSINDVYRIEGVADGRSGGMARVRALRAELERNAPDLLLLHGGDFLSPSFLGRTYQGAQMIDVMNRMDGSAAAGSLDSRMFVAFGNHEFDDTHCGKEGPLAKLVGQSEFTWLASNLDFTKCAPLRGLAGHPRIAANQIIESGGLRIGIFGVTLSYPVYAAIVSDPLEAACREVALLRSKGVDVVVALTHLSYVTDLEMLGRGTDGKELSAGARTCAHAPDLVIGGHDHKSMALPSAAPRLFKADADAESAWVIEVEKAGEQLKIKGRLVVLDRKRALDRLVQGVTNTWLRQHDEGFCRNECKKLDEGKAKACQAAAKGGACLRETYVRTASLIETEEITNRSFETGFGNWVADQMRTEGRADVAFLNAGSIRINYNLPRGARLTRRHLEQMFPFKGKLVIREVSGGDLWRAMEHAIEKRGEGPWAHFSGMAVELTPAGSAKDIARIVVRRHDNSVVEIGPDSTLMFKVASIGFVLANGDRHGFKLCGGETSVSRCIQTLEAAAGWPVAGEAAEIAGLVRTKMREAGRRRGLVLRVDRRLCDRGQKACLISQWRRS